MNEIADLKKANPVEAEPIWGTSPEGRTAFTALLDTIDSGSQVPSPNRRIRRPWIFATAGFAVTVAILIPVFFAGGAPEPDPLSVPGNPYWTISDDVLADGVVTTDEFLFGADAVVSCTQTLSEEPDTVVTYELESDRGISFTYSDPEAFEPCHTRIFRDRKDLGGPELATACIRLLLLYQRRRLH